MKVFISYHRKDSYYRYKVENILKNVGIEYYAVPEDADFNGKKAETIKTFLCNQLKKCDVLLCLIGDETYSRPHVDREIHTALKGSVGERLGIVAVLLNTRRDQIANIEKRTFPKKIMDNKNYVVFTAYNDLNNNLLDLLSKALDNARNKKLQTNHRNPCMPLRGTLYYDN